MVNEVDKTEFNKILYGQLEEKRAELRKKVEEAKTTLFAPDTIDREDWLYLYESRVRKLDKLDKLDLKKYITAVELFNKIAHELDREFGAKVDTEKHTIRFKWFGRRLSYPVELLSKHYNFHSGMFSFDSSFTTHQAYTEDDYEFRIDIDPKAGDTILIDFGDFGI